MYLFMMAGLVLFLIIGGAVVALGLGDGSGTWRGVEVRC